ncbi:AI-2E family transporter [Novosphingobium sp. PhB165]|uniref:AI-2E family transporter n=1 Tax=Novosphingobium sp. PhB165 TaxID=2485105 RepID=UPI001A9E124B|nr:AI-2E family transporter [Novosphingobium sp. PhB165]
MSIIAVILMTAAAYYASSVFAPLVVALYIMALVWPLQRMLQARLPKLLALALTLLATLAIGFLFVLIFSWAVGRVIRPIMLDTARYQYLLEHLADRFEIQGFSIAGLWSEYVDLAWTISAIRQVGGHLQTTLTFWIIAITYLLLGLLEVDDMRAKIAVMRNREASWMLLEGTRIIAGHYRRHLLVRTLMSVLTGLLVWLFACVVGLPFAGEWGVIAFALNYIPFIGPFFATLLPTLLAMTTFDTWQAVILVFLCLNVIQFMVGSYIEPRVAGSVLSISPMLVLFVIFFWTFLWGILGTLLAVPITVAIITFCGLHPRSRWVVELFGKAAAANTAEAE